MSKLTQTDKIQLTRPVGTGAILPPPLPIRPPKDYLEFVTLAARWSRIPNKPVDFSGRNWRL